MILKVVIPYSSGHATQIYRANCFIKKENTLIMTTPNEGSINFPLFIDTHFYIYVFTKYFSEGNASYTYAKKYVAYA